MAYATVMVSLALDELNEACLEAAGQIAERFDAGIIGIVASQFNPPLYFTSGEQAQNLIDQGLASLKNACQNWKRSFAKRPKIGRSMSNGVAQLTSRPGTFCRKCVAPTSS